MNWSDGRDIFGDLERERGFEVRDGLHEGIEIEALCDTVPGFLIHLARFAKPSKGRFDCNIDLTGQEPTTIVYRLTELGHPDQGKLF